MWMILSLRAGIILRRTTRVVRNISVTIRRNISSHSASSIGCNGFPIWLGALLLTSTSIRPNRSIRPATLDSATPGFA